MISRITMTVRHSDGMSAWLFEVCIETVAKEMKATVSREGTIKQKTERYRNISIDIDIINTSEQSCVKIVL